MKLAEHSVTSSNVTDYLLRNPGVKLEVQSVIGLLFGVLSEGGEEYHAQGKTYQETIVATLERKCLGASHEEFFGI